VTTSSVRLGRVDGETLSYLEQLLVQNDLPARDVRANPECFYVAFVDGGRVGAGGIEVYGSEGLLRSVVVEASERGEGYGTAICDALERRAAQKGVERLYLLTTTATEFFANRGYEPVDRSSVPPAIGETTEFSELCPDSATCMRKPL